MINEEDMTILSAMNNLELNAQDSQMIMNQINLYTENLEKFIINKKDFQYQKITQKIVWHTRSDEIKDRFIASSLLCQKSSFFYDSYFTIPHIYLKTKE